MTLDSLDFNNAINQLTDKENENFQNVKRIVIKDFSIDTPTIPKGKILKPYFRMKQRW